jgi:hypothetical protein
MNAAELIRRLQSMHPVPKPDISDIETLRRAAEARGLDFEQAQRAFRAAPVDIAADNLDAVRPFLTADMQQRIAAGQIVAGTIGLETFDAYSREVDDGWAIVFHLGFTQFLYQAARSVARLFPSRSGAGRITEALLEETAAALKRQLWFYNAAAIWHPTADPIEPEQLEIANVLSGAADEFFLAHEMGHIVTNVAGVAETARRLAPLPDATPAHQVEFACDGYALGLVLDAAAARGAARDRDFAVAGAEFGLQLMRLMARFGVAFAATHPAADERIDYLRRLLREQTDGAGDTELSRRLEAVLEHSVATMSEGLRLDNVDEDEVSALLPRIEAEAVQAAPHARRPPMTEMIFMSRLQSFGSQKSVAVALARLCTQRLERGNLDPQHHLDEDILADATATQLLMRASRSYYERLSDTSKNIGR